MDYDDPTVASPVDESESSEDGEEVGLKTLSHNLECIVAVGGEFCTLDIHARWSTAEVEVDLHLVAFQAGMRWKP